RMTQNFYQRNTLVSLKLASLYINNPK
ncbi:hypothetical protein EUTSA_v100011930mg, partial [Eutrema salsugineum]